MNIKFNTVSKKQIIGNSCCYISYNLFIKHLKSETWQTSLLVVSLIFAILRVFCVFLSYTDKTHPKVINKYLALPLTIATLPLIGDFWLLATADLIKEIYWIRLVGSKSPAFYLVSILKNDTNANIDKNFSQSNNLTETIVNQNEIIINQNIDEENRGSEQD